MSAFRVETVELDLPPLAAALGRRLRDAGVPVTPERPADFAHALTLVRPVSRRRLYWTARSVFVSDRAHVGAFDAVFAAVFGLGAQAPAEPTPSGEPSAPAPGEGERRPARSGDGEVVRSGMPSSSPPGGEDGPEAEVPLALASDEERLAGKRFDALDAEELAQLYRLMSRLELATPLRRTRRRERGRHGQHVDLRRTLRASLRTAGEPIGLARRRRRVAASPARPAVRHLRVDGALRPRVPAVPRLRQGQRRGVRVRHAADTRHPGAGGAQPRARDRARRGRARPTGRAGRGSATR